MGSEFTPVRPHVRSPKDAILGRDDIRTYGHRDWYWRCRLCAKLLRGHPTREEAIRDFERHVTEEHGRREATA